jgi:hypothetical protein
MTGDEAVEQPRVGFSYSFWFKCTQCDSRVEVDSELYELQSTGRAGYSMCTPCGAELDIRRPHVRALRNPEDVAKNNDSVGHLVWYHSSRYESWPDLEAYTADVAAEARQTAEKFDMFDADRRIATKLSLAVHLGTYEAAIENILRRLGDQDHANLFETRYWLHRVEIKLGPNDLHPDVVDEFCIYFGDVELEQVQALGARAVRYVNCHEAIGSVSLAIDPAVVGAVSTIALPVTEAALAETADAAAATERMVASTHRADDDTGDSWAAFAGILESEYLSGVNPQLRDLFGGAVGGEYEDPVEFHRRFRIVAGMLTQADVVIGLLAGAPRRRQF